MRNPGFPLSSLEQTENPDENKEGYGIACHSGNYRHFNQTASPENIAENKIKRRDQNIAVLVNSVNH